MAVCSRCERVLDRRRWTRLDLSLAASVAALLLLIPAAVLPALESTLRNLVYEQSRLVSSVPEIYRDVWFPFALGFVLFALLFPALHLSFRVVSLAAIRLRWRSRQAGRVFRWSEELRMWSMTDVVAIGGVIAYYRAAIPADVGILAGAWCYLGVALLARLADISLDRRAVWSSVLPDLGADPSRASLACSVCEMTVRGEDAGQACPRCGATLEQAIGWRLTPAAAAFAGAIPLLFPAMAWAVIVNHQIGGVWEHTIIGTIQLLADYGYWQYGIVLLFAGVAIPLFALAVMGFLLLRVRFPSRRGLMVRTRLYRIVRRLVRWPMIIPFIAAVAAPIVDFRNLDDILAGPGATPYFAMVVLLMIAVRLFEPRWMWISAGETR